uniref:Uncharacterized protein n=1 Tax=Elaeophora elaphi TaxID=1147741 RepID=A0A0R3RZ75_9BILA
MECLRNSTIFIALWNIIYSILQIVIFAWQTKHAKNRQWEFENRLIPSDRTIGGFQARFPGLHGILTETPERRRINALFALAIATLIVALMHLILSVMLFYGAITKRINFIWPWFFTALPLIILSASYAIIWWSGDIFDVQLIMSIIEFILSLAINSICFVIVLLFFFCVKGTLKSPENANYSKSGNKLPPRKKNNWNIELPKERWYVINMQTLILSIFTVYSDINSNSLLKLFSIVLRINRYLRKMRQKDRNYHLLRSSLISKESNRQLRLTANRLAEHNRILSGDGKTYRCNYKG